MELRHLRSFVAVAEEGHVRRAAKRLHITQPPLTRQIHQLEDELDAQLFVRTPKGVELTDAGRVFLTEARKVLHSVDEASRKARRADRGAAGTIDIAIFGTGIFGVIPMLLRAHADANPDVKFVLHNMTKQEQIEALVAERVSLAFNRLMRPLPHLTSGVLLSEPLMIAAPVGHPLTQIPEPTLGDLRDVPMVLFPTGYRPSFIDKVHALCAEEGFSPRVAAEVADVVHGIVMVATSGVVGIVPYSGSNLNVPGVEYRPLSGPTKPSVDLCYIHRTEDESPLLHELIATMRKEAVEVQDRLEGLVLPACR